MILKRLADAERDGDRIYAVIRGVGSSSDGREKGLTAPNAAGQLRALRRAYQKAGISPARLGLIEAHGTGTVVGDRTEAAALAQVMGEAGAEPQSCAMGSVKSLIGHSKCAAGIAGLLKATLAVHHKVLPPTLVESPNPQVSRADSPLFLNTAPRPWIRSRDEPRCAGVSSFGFGGTNVHLVLEEYTQKLDLPDNDPVWRTWPSELFVWRGERGEIQQALQQQLAALRDGAQPELADYAASLWKTAAKKSGPATLTIVATDQEQLVEQMAQALESVATEEPAVTSPRGIYFTAKSDRRGKVAFLFPGQGAQYPNMIADLAMSFAEVRAAVDLATVQIGYEMDVPLGRQIYPPSAFDDEQLAATTRNLARTQVAQPAIGAVSLGLLRLLRRLGIEPDAVAGHSYGEFVALHAAGVYDESDLIRLSLRRGKLMRAAAENAPGAMAAVSADRETVARLVADVAGTTLANLNAPQQTVISAAEKSLTEAMEKLTAAGVATKRLDVSCAFHSPAVAAACAPLAREMADVHFKSPQTTVYSNTTGRAHSESPDEIHRVMAEHIASPVRFMDQINAMYVDGVRVFVEVGPQSQLCGLVRRILADRPHMAVATDVKGRNGLTQLQHCLAQLLCAGIQLDIGPLFEHRSQRTFDPRRMSADTGRVEYSQSTWMVNGFRSRLCHAPEPKLLGQRWEEEEAASPVTVNAPATKTRPSHDPMPNASPAAITPAAGRNTRDSVVAMESNQSMSQPNERLLETTNGQFAQSFPQRGSHDELPADVEAVMLGFQDVMAKFLDTQRAVMQQYLAGGEIANELLADMPATGMPAASIAAQPIPAEQQPASAADPLASAAVGELGSSGHSSDEGNSEVSAATTTAASEENNGSQAAADGTAMSMFEVTAKLIELVSERTGYPEDMLDPNLDLEADLGIDSIKRVEILGDLAESLGIMGAEDDSQSAIELEKLTTIRTLQGILDYLQETLFSDSSTNGGEMTPSNGQAESNAPASMRQNSSNSDGVPSTNGDDVTTAIQRGLVRLTAAPLTSRGGMPIPSGAIVITDDGRGIAAELAERFADFGQTVALLRMSKSPPTSSEGLYEGDLTCDRAVEKLVARLRSDVGQIAGFVHLLPLATADGEAWSHRAERDVKSFYLLARALQPDLQTAAQLGMAFALAPTTLGGGLGFGELPPAEQFLPGHGGLLGFAKCLAQETPDVLVRGVDFAPSTSANEVCDALLAELTMDDGPLEVGYQNGKRLTWEPVSAPLSNATSTAALLDNNSVVLLTGGARGITAAIAADIARRYQSQLILVGRSPSPPLAEPADIAPLETAAEIKSGLIARRKERGETAAPAEIEAEYQLLLREREMRRNIQAIRAAGSHVEYHSLDVRDETAFAEFIARIRQQFGRLDGIIHGAGVIEDKLIRDKTPESFDRVFGTKVRSAWNISQLSPDGLKFCVFFASVASRYGNKGQSDYAAANEVLCKLAADLDRRWPARVFAVAWGPWAEIGMVSDLEKHLTARGVTLISPRAGTDHLLRELQFGAKGETEVLIAGGAERLVSPPRGPERLTQS